MTNTSDIVQKLDACNTLNTEICDLVSKRIEAGYVLDTFKSEVEKQRVRMILNREEYKSIFGGTNTSVILQRLENMSVANSKASM